MANQQNLKPLTASEAREIGSKGGKASGRARRVYKTLREACEGLLDREEMVAELRRVYKNKSTPASAKVSIFQTLEASLGEKPKEHIDTKIEITLKGGDDFAN